MAPDDEVRRETGTRTISASLAALRKTSTLRPRRKCQQETPSTTIAAVVSPARITCAKAQRANRLESSSQMLVSSARPSTILYPTGCCIHEFATMMKKADSHAPERDEPHRRQVDARPSRFQPKIQRPRNVASSMNAASPSIASGAPKTSPTNVE